MEAVAAVASFVAIGQALAATPKVIEVLRSLVEVRQEVLQLLNEVEFLNTFGILIRETAHHLPHDDSNPNFRFPQPALLGSVEADLVSVVSQLEKLARECDLGKKENGQLKISRLKWLQHRKKIASLSKRAKKSRDYLQLILSCNSLYASTSNGKMLVDIHTIVTNPAHTGDLLLLPLMNQTHQINAVDAGTSLVQITTLNGDSRQTSEAHIIGTSPLPVSLDEGLTQNHGPLIQMKATLRRVCPKRCACQCHSPRPRSHPAISPIYGWFSYAYNSVLQLGTRNCDIPICQRACAPIWFNIRFPLLVCSWGLEISLSLGGISGIGASLHLRIARKLSMRDDIFFEIDSEKVKRLRLAMVRREVSPLDRSDRQSVLEYAISHQKYEVVLMFLEESTSILKGTDCGKHAAAYARHQLCHWSPNDRDACILRKVIELDDENAEDRWPIHDAIRCRGGLTAVLDESTEGIDDLDNFGRTALYWAVYHRDSTAIQTLIAYGANPNVRNLCGRTPLMHAARLGRLDCAKTLIRGGCDVNVLDYEGFNALYSALSLQTGDTAKMVSFLLDHGTQLTSSRSGNAMHWLVWHPFAKTVEEVFRVLIRAGVNLEEMDSHNLTPLMGALAKNNTVMLHLLLDIGCEFDKSSSTANALFAASYLADAESMDIIAETNFTMDVRVRGKWGTPLDTFEWRMKSDRSQLPASIQPPDDDDAEAFRGLLQGIRDRYLAAEIRTLETVIGYIKERESMLAQKALKPIILEKSYWNIPAEHRTFRAINLQIKQGMTGAAIESIEEFVEVSRARVGTDPFGGDYCRSISLGDECLVVEST